MSKPAQPVIAVVGPTASGKSDLAVALAQAIGGEVINADSMQLYRGMDIGTAKPSIEQRDLGLEVFEAADVIGEPGLGVAGLPRADDPVSGGARHVDGAVGINASPPRASRAHAEH